MRGFKYVWGLTFLLLAAAGMLAIGPTEVQGAPPFQATVTPRPTVGLPPPTSAAETPVVRKVDVVLIVDKAEARPGEMLEYQAQVVNVTGQVATNVWLTCDLPEGVEIQEHSTSKGVIHPYGQRLSVEMGDFHAAFESYFVKIKARIRDDVAPGTELVHHANLTSDQAGGGERDARTQYYEVKTLVVEEGAASAPTPTPASQKVSALPVTGNGAVSIWVVIGFAILIVVVAVWENKEHIHLPG